jgi:hypothetical protein
MRRIYILFFAFMFSSLSYAEKRVALVIGNSAYKYADELPNPRNDANAIAKKLKFSGFTVVQGIDLDKKGMESIIEQFSKKLKGSDVGLFFYAGHGMQANGVNYLIPVDAKLSSEDDLITEVISANIINEKLESEPRVNLIFLDACRDNPLAENLAENMGLSARSIQGLSSSPTRKKSRSLGQGNTLLSVKKKNNGTLIVYATQPGNVAEDGDGNHSPFTLALLKFMTEPGLDISKMMRKVRKEVKKQTNGVQIPWDHSSLIGDFAFIEIDPETLSAEKETQFWQGVGSDADLAIAYIKLYPNGKYVSEAKKISSNEIYRKKRTDLVIGKIDSVNVEWGIVVISTNTDKLEIGDKIYVKSGSEKKYLIVQKVLDKKIVATSEHRLLSFKKKSTVFYVKNKI